MALITGIAFAGLSVGLDTWQRGTRKIQDLDRRVSLERLLRRQLSVSSGGLKGTTSTLEFASQYSLANGLGDDLAVKYTFESGNLLYVETPLAQYMPDSSSNEVTQSLGGFTKIGFAFLNDDALGKPTWFEQWDYERLPSAIRITVDQDVMTVPMVNR
jgi:hypothetical protein